MPTGGERIDRVRVTGLRGAKRQYNTDQCGEYPVIVEMVRGRDELRVRYAHAPNETVLVPLENAEAVCRDMEADEKKLRAMNRTRANDSDNPEARGKEGDEHECDNTDYDQWPEHLRPYVIFMTAFFNEQVGRQQAAASATFSPPLPTIDGAPTIAAAPCEFEAVWRAGETAFWKEVVEGLLGADCDDPE